MLFDVKHHWYDLDLANEDFMILEANHTNDEIGLIKKGSEITFNGVRLYLLGESQNSKIETDYLIVDDYRNYLDFHKNIAFEHLVVTTDVKPWEFERIEEEAIYLAKESLLVNLTD